MRNFMFLTALLGCTASGAIVTQYTTLVDFTNAVGPTQTFSFGEPDGTTISTLGSLGVVATVAGDPFGKANDGGVCGSKGDTTDCFAALLFFPTPPVTGFAFFNGDLTVDEEAFILVVFENGDPFQFFTINLGGEPALTPIFFGMTSDVPISAVAIFSRDIGTTSDPGTRANVVDDVVIATAVVPEPSTGLSLGAGILLAAGLASLRENRRRRTSRA